MCFAFILLLSIWFVLFYFFHSCFFFFKQKTAYEMRISDWSSDVCSSDLFALVADFAEARGHEARHARLDRRIIVRLTKPVRQFVDTPGARERQNQRAGDEMIASENIFLGRVRSEEHTSELQSLMRISYAVLCLKKTQRQQYS